MFQREWRYLKNTTSIPIQNKRGRPANTSQDKASNKQPRKQKNKPSEIVNANQTHVDRHQTVNQNNVDGQHLQPSSVVHLNTDTRTSEYPDYYDGKPRRVNWDKLEYHMIERLLLSTHFSPNKLHMTFTMIQIQRPWQNVANARTGPNGRMQFNRN
jgi:hypothetical protein